MRGSYGVGRFPCFSYEKGKRSSGRGPGVSVRETETLYFYRYLPEAIDRSRSLSCKGILISNGKVYLSICKETDSADASYTLNWKKPPLKPNRNPTIISFRELPKILHFLSPGYLIHWGLTLNPKNSAEKSRRTQEGRDQY